VHRSIRQGYSAAAVVLRLGVLRFDLTGFPVVVVKASGTLDAADARTLVDEQQRILGQDQPFVLVFDAMELKGVGSGELRTLAKLAKETAPRTARYLKMMALATQSPVIRGALKALLWLQPLAHPFQVCASFDEAMRVARAAAPTASPPTRAGSR
jgi:hypothetical protein